MLVWYMHKRGVECSMLVDVVAPEPSYYLK